MVRACMKIKKYTKRLFTSSFSWQNKEKGGWYYVKTLRTDRSGMETDRTLTSSGKDRKTQTSPKG